MVKGGESVSEFEERILRLSRDEAAAKEITELIEEARKAGDNIVFGNSPEGENVEGEELREIFGV